MSESEGHDRTWPSVLISTSTNPLSTLRQDSANSSSPIPDSLTTCQAFIQTANVIVIPIISLVGVLLNALCILVFAQIIRNEKRLNGGHMFKYLLVKSVYDCIQFVIHLYAPFYYCQQCPLTYQTLWSQVWYVWFYYYFESIVELCSGLLELAATFDCLIRINKKFFLCKGDVFFYAVILISFIYSATFYIFRLFDFEIVHVVYSTTEMVTPPTHALSTNDLNYLSNGERVYSVKSYYDRGAKTNLSASSAEYYTFAYTEFSRTNLSKFFNSMHSLTRDGIIVVALIILNILILSTLKKSIRKKRSLLNYGRDTITSLNDPTAMRCTSFADIGNAGAARKSKTVVNIANVADEVNEEETNIILSNEVVNSVAVRRSIAYLIISKAERRTTIMVILTGVNYVIGHFPSMLFYLPFKLNSPFWICMRHVNLIFFYVSYVSPFFLYISFNNLFRHYFFRAFRHCVLGNFLVKKLKFNSYELSQTYIE